MALSVVPIFCEGTSLWYAISFHFACETENKIHQPCELINMLAATLHQLMVWSHRFFVGLHLWIACFPHVNLCLTPWVVYTCKLSLWSTFPPFEVNADIYLTLPPPTPSPALWKISVQQMEEECSGDGYNPAAWESWATPHPPIHTFFWSCQLQPPSGHAAKRGPQCCGWQIPFLPPELPASLVFSDHFKMMISSLASRKGTNVPVLVSAVSTAWRTQQWGWAGTWVESPSHVLSTQVQCSQRNDMEIDAGRLVPAVINE